MKSHRGIKFSKKYFVIGFNKTATSTIHNLFLNNGLRSQHDSLWDLLNYDCFSDGKFSQIGEFSELYKQFYNSIFILNTRNLRNWIISRFNHGYRGYINGNSDRNMYPYTEDKIIRWVEYYNNHYLSVLNFFKDDPDKLIIVSIDDPNWISYLSDQLHFKINNIYSTNIHPPCEKQDEIISLVDTTFERINGKCILKDTNQLDHLLKLYRNNLGKPV
jgi:hypothetical protein